MQSVVRACARVPRVSRRGGTLPSFSTYQSKHNSISSEEVRVYLERIPGVELRETHNSFVVKDCAAMPPGFCLKPSGTDKSDNQYKLSISMGVPGDVGGGTYYCYRCNSKGSWYDFKNLVNGVKVSRGVAPGQAPAQSDATSQRVRPVLKLPNQVF